MITERIGRVAYKYHRVPEEQEVFGGAPENDHEIDDQSVQSWQHHVDRYLNRHLELRSLDKIMSSNVGH